MRPVATLGGLGKDGVRPPLDDEAARAELSRAPSNRLPLPLPPSHPVFLPRVQVTLAVDEQLRELLLASRRRRAGETARVAALLGLSVCQVCRALARIPVVQDQG
jgi:hypothetical protein